MRISVRQEADGCWYVIDERGERYAQCGRWSTAEYAQEEARRFLHSLGYKYEQTHNAINIKQLTPAEIADNERLERINKC